MGEGNAKKKKGRKMKIKTNFTGFTPLPRVCLIYLLQGWDKKKLEAEVFLSCSCNTGSHTCLD
jgi:hypothetical protein